MSARSVVADVARTLVSVGRPDLAVVSTPSAPLASRFLADPRTSAVVRGVPCLALLVAVVVLTLYASTSLAAGRWSDSLPVVVASAVIDIGRATGEIAFLSDPSQGAESESPATTAAFLVVVVAVVLVAATYTSSAIVRGVLDDVHGSLLGLLPGVYARLDESPFVRALAGVRPLRTATSDALVERVASRRASDPPLRWSTSTGRVLRALTDGGRDSLVADARRGRDHGLVDDFLRLALLLPLEADYDAVVGTGADRASLEARHADVRRVLLDVDDGTPVEWALRRAVATGSAW